MKILSKNLIFLRSKFQKIRFRFDQNKVATTPHKVPHMMPSLNKFVQEMARQNVKPDDHIVEEKFEKYFGYLARCEENFGT